MLLVLIVPLERMRIHLRWVVKLYAQIQHFLVILQPIYVLLFAQQILITTLKVENVLQAVLVDILRIGKLIELVSSNVQVVQFHSMEHLLSDASKLLNAAQDYSEIITPKNAVHAREPYPSAIQ